MNQGSGQGASAAAGATDAAAAGVDGAGAAPRLLYIDDDVALSALVRRTLTRRGYAVTLAGDGAAGVRLAADQAFDLVALDHHMPGQDGITTMAALKALPLDAPILYVTGSDDSRTAVAALKAGAFDYVVKSGAEDFFDLLDNAFRQALSQISLKRERDRIQQELVESNGRLERLVEMQQVMLREVNHRVANSLQLVSSLVHLQSNLVRDEAAREALRDTQQRIAAILQIHRRLYTSDDVQSVDMADYLGGLTAELAQSLGAKGDHRRIVLDAEPVLLDTDKAVSLGVLVAELVTNACKYAYGEETAGEVRVRFGKLGVDGHARLRLVVEDDGCGLPDEGAPAQGTGLGRKVIQAMAQNLGSRVDFDTAHRGVRAVMDIAA